MTVRRSRAFRLAWLTAVVSVASLLPAGLLRAQTPDAYTVRNVEEDITDSNMSQARDRAFLAAQRDAYQILLQRLTAAADWPRLPRLASDDDLKDMVLYVGFDQEKRSPSRYLATLTVGFKPDMVRRVLKGANIAYAEWRGRPIPVLPQMSGDAGAVNAWREAWRSGAAQGLIPFVIAPPQDAVDGGEPALAAALGQRFGGEDAVVANASVQRGEGGKLKLDVSLSGIGPIGAALNGTRSYAGENGEAIDPLLRRAVADIAKTANDTWKSGNLLQYDHSATLTVMVPLAGLDDWLAVRDRLARSTAVRSYEIAALAKAEAALVLHYVGEQSQLESAVMQNGLVLAWLDDHWVLRTTTQQRPAVNR